MQRLRAEGQDLLKLRNEVTQLRAGSKEMEKLRAENQQLRSAAAAARTAVPPTPPSPVPPVPAAGTGAQFPKESWTFSGYASPDAALVSAIWAMKEGNP